MINVDDRAGSIDLVPLLRVRGFPVNITRLAYGDINFMGRGPEGVPVPVGIEVKSFKDTLTCMTDGRFAGHQLPGLIQSYQQPYLLIAGQWRANQRSGLLEYRRERGQWYEANVGQRRFMWTDLETWLLSVQVKAGLTIHRSSDWDEATHWIGTLYNWWTKKEYEDHRGHIALFDRMHDGLVDRGILVRPSLCRMVAAQLPSIGINKSQSVASYFGSVEAMVGADQTEWEQIPGIGPTIARKIYQALRESR